MARWFAQGAQFSGALANEKKQRASSPRAAGPSGPGSASEHGARTKSVLGYKFRRGEFLAVLVLGLEDLDAPPLGSHEEARGADFGNLADLAFHRAEGTEQVLAAVEDLQLLAIERGPGPWGGIAPAYEVVDEIHMGCPVDLRLG